MKEIVELLFEDVDIAKLGEAIEKLHPNFELLRTEFTTKIVNTEYIDGESIVKALTLAKDGSYFFEFKVVVVKAHQLKDAGLTVLKYSNKYDITLFFEMAIVTRIISIEHFMKWSRELAIFLSAADWMCGLEPADDKDTQFFSRNSVGPLAWV